MKPQQNKTKAEQIRTWVLDEISSGRIKPGERLLSERDLSAQLGVSRMPLREALRALCNMGVLVTRRGGGTYVAKRIKKNPFALSGQTVNKIAVLEMIQVRMVIEAEAARLAAENAGEDEIESIRKHMDIREKQIKQQLLGELSENDTTHNADTEFHRAIVQASHNSVFVDFFDSIMETISIHQRQASFKPDMFVHTSDFHRKVYEAIARHDSTAAAEMMRQHIENVGAALKDAFGAMEKTAKSDADAAEQNKETTKKRETT